MQSINLVMAAPDQVKYEDFSPMLRDILSRGLREARTKAKAQG